MKSIILIAVLATVAVESRRQVKEYVIDLDKAPEDRYLELLPQFNDTVRKISPARSLSDLDLDFSHYYLALARFSFRSRSRFLILTLLSRSGDFGINILQRMLF